MSVWDRLSIALAALRAGEPLSVVFDHFTTEPEYSVGFTIAIIGLGAKMAKADGQVTHDEVAAFREVFYIASEDEKQAARVFNLAREDVAGYKNYAQQIYRMFAARPQVLRDLMEGLFHIALADGEYHPHEDSFLEDVARVFRINEAEFNQMRKRLAPGAAADPFDVLGVTPDMPVSEIRKVWRQLVKDNHPDLLIARGVPSEAIKLAETRLHEINRAWEIIGQAE